MTTWYYQFFDASSGSGEEIQTYRRGHGLRITLIEVRNVSYLKVATYVPFDIIVLLQAL